MPLDQHCVAGIGYACAKALGYAGSSLLLVDINEESLQDAEQSLQNEGFSVSTCLCDVSDKIQVEAAIKKAVDTYNSLDILVANAGIVKAAEFLRMSEEDFDAVIKVNLKGTFLTAQAAANQMVLQGKGGSIITMSSVNGITAIPTIAAYNASKGGIDNLTRCMAVALAPYNIRVNAVGPGSIMTELLEKVADDKAVVHKILSRTPMLRIGEPREVGNVVKFLACDESSYITGQTIYVDGGRLALNYTVDVPPDVE